MDMFDLGHALWGIGWGVAAIASFRLGGRSSKFRVAAIGFALLALVFVTIRIVPDSIDAFATADRYAPFQALLFVASAGFFLAGVDDLIRQRARADGAREEELRQARLEGHESGVRWALAAERERVTDG